MADDVKTGIRLEADGSADYKKALKDAAAANETLEEALQKVGAASDKAEGKSDALDKAVRELQQESKTLAAELKAVESGFDASTSAEERASAKKDVLTRQIETQEAVVKGLTEQLDRMSASTDTDAAALDKQREKVYKAQTALNKMQGELRDTEAEMNGTTDAADELGDQMQESGEQAGHFGDVLGANLTSQAIIKGLETVAKLAERIGQAMYDAARDAAGYADDILTLSTQTGLGTDELQEFQYMSELVDVSLDTVTGSMAKLITKMSSARKGSDTAAAAFEALGVNVLNADGSLRDSREVFFDVLDALGRVEDPTERDAAAMEIFGKKAQDLNPLISAGSSTLEKFAKEARETGYVLDRGTLDKLGALDDSFQRLSNTGTIIQNRFGAAAAPALQRVLDKANELALSADWERFGEVVGGVLDRTADKAIDFVEKIDLDEAGRKVEGFFTYIDENGDEIVNTIEAIGTAFLGWQGIKAVGALAGEVKSLYGWLTALAGALGISVGAAAGGLVAAGVGVYELGERAKLLGEIGTIGSGRELREYADNVAYLEQELQKAQAAFDETALYAPDTLYMAQDALDLARIALQNAQAEQEAAEAARASADAAGSNVAEKAEEAAAAAESGAAATESLARGSTEALQLFDESAGEIVSSFEDGVDEMSTAAAEAVKNTNDVMDSNMAVLNANADIWGQDMMRNLANGILTGANSYLIPAINEAAGAVEARLGFSEPETGPLADFHTYAPDMMALFAQGIRDGEEVLRTAIGQTFDLAPMIRAQSGLGGRTLNYGGVSVVINAPEGASADEIYETFACRLQHDVADREAVFST